MDVLSVLPQIQVALAGVLILARILLQVATRRDRAAQRSGQPVSAELSAAPSSRSTRSLQVAVAAGQTASAAMTIMTWLHSAGLI